jgi:hypothetical protein
VLPLFDKVANGRDKGDEEKSSVDSKSFHVCCLRLTKDGQEKVEACRINQQYGVVIFKLSAQ